MSDNTQEDTQAGAGAPFVPPPVAAAPEQKVAKPRAARPSRARTPAAPAADAGGAIETLEGVKAPGTPVANKTDPMMEIICITLHDTKEVPPNGQFVGVNGKQFIIPPGRKCRVPRYVVEALNNAVVGVPDINDQLQVTGVRDAPRLPYTIHLGE